VVYNRYAIVIKVYTIDTIELEDNSKYIYVGRYFSNVLYGMDIIV